MHARTHTNNYICFLFLLIFPFAYVHTLVADRKLSVKLIRTFHAHTQIYFCIQNVLYDNRSKYVFSQLTFWPDPWMLFTTFDSYQTERFVCGRAGERIKHSLKSILFGKTKWINRAKNHINTDWDFHCVHTISILLEWTFGFPLKKYISKTIEICYRVGNAFDYRVQRNLEFIQKKINKKTGDGINSKKSK